MEEASVVFLSKSVEKTMWLGERLGNQLSEGDIVALIGDLGGGKTWFTKGVAVAFHIDPAEIVSPTFTLVNEFCGRFEFFHIDLYRLASDAEIMALDLEGYFLRKGIIIVEWADRWPGELPERRIQVELRLIDETTRELRFSGVHSRAREVIRALREDEGLRLKGIERL